MTTIDTFLRLQARVEPVDPRSVIAAGALLGGCYELHQRLGVGGMATVWRAYDHLLGREVAIKLPHLAGRDRATAAELVDLFEREASVTARLAHPNIVALHHLDAHDGTPYAVLELLRGETLAERLDRRRTVPVLEAIAILDGVLRALGHAHDRGVVHRDLSPRNVFLTVDDQVKLLDFGVAIEHGDAQVPAAGTPGYMAPEHAARPDPRGDLWAAGVLFLECVTGERTRPQDPPRSVPATLPGHVRAALLRVLDPDPDRRIASAHALRAALLPPRRRSLNRSASARLDGRSSAIARPAPFRAAPRHW